MTKNPWATRVEDRRTALLVVLQKLNFRKLSLVSKSRLLLRAKSRQARILNLALFVILTLSIHYAYRWWAYEMEYRLFGQTIISIDFLQHMGRMVFNQCVWLVNDLFRIGAKIVGQVIYMPDGGGVAIDGACSGLKQMLQFAILILLFPGPWKHKLWFIPLGVIVMHLTNVARVFGLCMVMWADPDYFSFFHDYFFRPLFYLVIFILWVIWTEYLRPLS